jgi:hypothetical protein
MRFSPYVEKENLAAMQTYCRLGMFETSAASMKERLAAERRPLRCANPFFARPPQLPTGPPRFCLEYVAIICYHYRKIRTSSAHVDQARQIWRI